VRVGAPGLGGGGQAGISGTGLAEARCADNWKLEKRKFFFLLRGIWFLFHGFFQPFFEDNLFVAVLKMSNFLVRRKNKTIYKCTFSTTVCPRKKFLFEAYKPASKLS
jgi:hypothetical protein